MKIILAFFAIYNLIFIIFRNYFKPIFISSQLLHEQKTDTEEYKIKLAKHLFSGIVLFIIIFSIAYIILITIFSFITAYWPFYILLIIEALMILFYNKLNIRIEQKFKFSQFLSAIRVALLIYLILTL